MKFVAALLVVVTALVSHTSQASAYQPGGKTPRVELVVSPLAYFDTEDGEPFGICHEVPVMVGGGPIGQVQVGIVESSVGAATRMWRSSAWQATLTASQLLNYNPQARQAIFTVPGKIDGPSAGAILTVGVLAGVLGHEIRPDVTMTGTINPDGVIGPVGGIPYKIEGAARAGMKVVLIPIHNAKEYDVRVRREVDLIEHGRKFGIIVKPVNDIWAAYPHFTGEEVPRPELAPVPVVAPRANELLKEIVPRWITLYKQARDEYQSWPDRDHTEYANKRIAEADVYIARAEKSLANNRPGMAFNEANWGASVAWVAREIGRYTQTYNLKGKEAAYGLIEQDDWLTREAASTAARLTSYTPKTLDQLAVYMESCSAFYTGISYYSLADYIRNNLPKDDDSKSEAWLLAGVEQQIAAWLSFRQAIDLLELSQKYDGRAIPINAPLDELATLYLASGEAAMAMVEELEVAKIEKSYSLASRKDAQIELALRDPAFGIASMSMNTIIPRLSKYFGNGKQYSIARLAAATTLHTQSAMLIAKYYSLGVEVDENYDITGYEQQEAVEAWLSDSEEQARRSIAQLMREGVDQTTVVQIYGIGRSIDELEMPERAEALHYYFSASVTAQILSRLAAAQQPDTLTLPEN